jgi:predicted metal-dependent peptidase
VKVLAKHASKVFNELPVEDKPKTRKNRREKYLDALPQEFNRQKYLDVAKSLSIPDKTAEGYITEFHKKGLIHREKQDHYINLSIDDVTTTET